MVKLKDCPCCGAKAEIKQLKKTEYAVKCTNLNCRLNITGRHLRMSADWLITELVKSWNRRVEASE